MNDILRDNTGDLAIVNGDIVIGDSEMQEVGNIIKSNPGDWKEDPVMGVGMLRFVKQQNNALRVERILRKMLRRDGKDFTTIKKKMELKNLGYGGE